MKNLSILSVDTWGENPVGRPLPDQANSIAFGSAPRREADIQPISQFVRQAVTQIVSRASSQASQGKFGFFQWQTQLQAVGRTPTVRTSNGRMVMQPTADVYVGGSNLSRLTAGGASRLVSSVQFDPRSNPSEHKLLTPPAETPPPKAISSFSG